MAWISLPDLMPYRFIKSELCELILFWMCTKLKVNEHLSSSDLRSLWAKVTYVSAINQWKDRQLNCNNWKTSPEFVGEKENFFGLHLLHITCLGSGEMKSQLQSPAYFQGFSSFFSPWICSEKNYFPQNCSEKIDIYFRNIDISTDFLRKNIIFPWIW